MAYQLAAYYFPNFHVDPHNEAVHGPGWTEWELVKRAEPRFPGHAQPKVPLWGHADEADPAVMATKIAAAADHGITSFLFDWYWYQGEPFLQRCLEEGFLGASNNDRLRFALMWANHDWMDGHPTKLHTPMKLWYPGKVDAAEFDILTDYVIEHYFRHPQYWTIDGAPYFSLYELRNFIDGLGGTEAAADALTRFREKTMRAGFPDLHLNAIVWGIPILPGERGVSNVDALLQQLRFSSVTSYVWVHHIPLANFPETQYREVADAAAQHWRQLARDFALPYHPNVTVGWDASPRTVQSDRYLNAGYPFMATLAHNTPAAFRDALQQAKDFLADRPASERIITLNAWNEWTEGSYLEPDTVNGMGHLEAIREVFGTRQ